VPVFELMRPPFFHLLIFWHSFQKAKGERTDLGVCLPTASPLAFFALSQVTRGSLSTFRLARTALVFESFEGRGGYLVEIRAQVSSSNISSLVNNENMYYATSYFMVERESERVPPT
jgi:hypothetical protein